MDCNRPRRIEPRGTAQPPGYDEVQAQILRRLGRISDQLQGRGIGPVQILHQQDDGPTATQGRENIDEKLKRLFLPLAGGGGHPFHLLLQKQRLEKHAVFWLVEAEPRQKECYGVPVWDVSFPLQKPAQKLYDGI